MIAAADLFQQRTPRERVLLGIMAIAIVGFALWYGAARPLSRAVEDAAAHHARASQDYSELRDAAAEFSGSEGRSAAPAAPEAILRSAENFGLTLDRHEIDSAREITVAAENADPAAVFAWIALLQKDYGVVVSNMAVTSAGDGRVVVEMVLARSGI